MDESVKKSVKTDDTNVPLSYVNVKRSIVLLAVRMPKCTTSLGKKIPPGYIDSKQDKAELDPQELGKGRCGRRGNENGKRIQRTSGESDGRKASEKRTEQKGGKTARLTLLQIILTGGGKCQRARITQLVRVWCL